MTNDYQAEPVMTFGKFKGIAVSTVLANYPDYALWANANVSFFKLSPSQIQDCVSRSRAGGRGIFPNSPIDDDGPDCGYGGMSYSDFGNN